MIQLAAFQVYLLHYCKQLSLLLIPSDANFQHAVITNGFHYSSLQHS